MTANGSEYAVVWLVAACLQMALIARFFVRTRAILPFVYAISFGLLLPVLGSTNLLTVGVSGCDVMGVYGSAFSTTIYVALFLGVLAVGPNVFSCEKWLPAVSAVSVQWLLGGLCLWFAVKTYLLYKYGLGSLLIRQVVHFSDIPFEYWETIANSIGRTLLIAVVVLVTVRLAMRIEHRFVVAIAGVALIIHFALGEADAGVRRTLVSLAILYVAVRWITDRGPRWRLMVHAAIGFMVLVVLGVYYTYIRSNIFDLEIQTQLISQSPEKSVSGLRALFTPQPEPVLEGSARLTREGPMELLCRLTERQWQRGTLSEGDVLGATLYLSIPRALFEDKEVIEPDTVLADTHDLYPNEEYGHIDLATSHLAQLQSDFGPAAWILTPILNAVALLIYGIAFVSRRFGTIVKILAAGGVWGIIASAESSLTALVSGMRDFFLLLVIVESVRRTYWLVISGARHWPVEVHRQS